MSIFTRASFRNATLGVASAAAMFAGSNAYAGDFTPKQCQLIATTGIEVAKAVGPSKLSKEFKQSFRNFLGANLTCDGPKDILTPDVNDIAAFNTISRILYAGETPISLSDSGLRSVDPKDVASREQRRSELPAYRPGG